MTDKYVKVLWNETWNHTASTVDNNTQSLPFKKPVPVNIKEAHIKWTVHISSMYNDYWQTVEKKGLKVLSEV